MYVFKEALTNFVQINQSTLANLSMDTALGGQLPSSRSFRIPSRHLFPE
ncbi:hypothetical protein KGM_201697 [Danaus plexippus plexippus]|uniref:Uncharacterized protein n=1 Tax=Danaus plexippus plexippus TaxID=278856 RepID=A0A212FHC9_DANPL|nr:hypothetical protein KGM_201697 [Danaus plexippus plexippus]